MKAMRIKNFIGMIFALATLFISAPSFAQTASINIKVDKKQSTKSQRKTFGVETKTIKTTNLSKKFDVQVSGNGDFYILTFLQNESSVNVSREEKTISAREPYKYQKSASCEYETSSTRLKSGWMYVGGGTSRVKGRGKLTGDIELCVLVIDKESGRVISSRYTSKTLYDYIVDKGLDKISDANADGATSSDDAE